MRSRVGWRGAGVALAVIVALSGCGATEPAVGGASASARAPTGLDRFYAQRLTWTPCGGRDCAQALVPLDYAAPSGRTINLAVTRLRTASGERLGTLFVNPGGPGASPRGLGEWFSSSGLERFDVVEWEPRGVTPDAAVRCSDAPATDRLLALDSSPDDAGELASLVGGWASFAQACAAHTDPDLLAHVSSAETARDLDVLRAASGDAALHFYGASYGTLIGARYAELFPGSVGRMVLDSPADLTGRSSVSQASGFEAGLHAFAVWCAGASDCPWRGDGSSVFAGIAGWLTGLDAAPLVVGQRALTQSLAASGVEGFLDAGEVGWPGLATALGHAKAGEGAGLLRASDQQNGRQPDGSYSPMLAAGAAIWCADRSRLSAAQAQEAWTRDRAAAPAFGYLMGPDVGCSSWPVAPGPAVNGRRAGAPPILLVGTTGDPATPYAWARESVGALASGVLLTYDGQGHVSRGRSSCVDAAVAAYLNDGVVPASETVCS